MAEEKPLSVPAPPPGKGDAAGEIFAGLKVSLMPSDLEGKKGPDMKLRSLIMIMVLILETGVVLTGLFLVDRRIAEKSREKADLERQFAAGQLEAERQEREMLQAMVFARQSRAAADALNRHVYVTRMAEFLERNTLDTVTVKRSLLDAVTGAVTMGVAAPTYRDMAEQIVHLSGLEQVVEFKNSGVSLSEGEEEGAVREVVAAFNLKLKPETWLYPKSQSGPNGN